MTEERCSLGVGCDECGVCYASAHGQPEQCPHYEPPKHPRRAEIILLAAILSWLAVVLIIVGVIAWAT